jgi:hypothetical protein
MVRVLGTQTRIVQFVETCFTGLTDFIAVRHTATDNGLPSNTRNPFQCNVLRVSRVLEMLCSDFSPIFFYLFSDTFSSYPCFPISFLSLLIRFIVLNLFSLYNRLVLRRRK